MSILDENDVDLEMQNLLSEFWATLSGLFAAVAFDEKELKGELLKDVMGLDRSSTLESRG